MMAERTAVVAINEFGWFDLGTSDAEAGRNFYAQLLGWAAEVVPDPQAGGYGFFKKDGKEVAGVGPLMNPAQPTAWTPYVLVADANATAAKIREAGGTVLTDPFDVMGQGWMAIVQDPAGAVFGIWQPGAHAGVELRDAPGSVIWVDSMSRDVEASKRFYEAVFGWKPEAFESNGAGEYWTFNKDGRGIAGVFPPMEGMPDQVPSYWQIHLGVTDADGVARRAAELGGTVQAGPFDIPTVGRYASIADPQGASFGILQPLPREG